MGNWEHPDHPADVTADRLARHYERWYHRFSQSERDHMGLVIQALREIASGERPARGGHLS